MRLVRRHVGVAFDHTALNVDGAAHSIDDADEFHQHPVARRLDDVATMLGDFGIDQFLAMGLELAKRTFLVSTHKLAITGDIACEYRGQPAFDTRLVHEDLPTYGGFKTRQTTGPPRSAPTFFVEIDLCLPTAPGCQLLEAATSVHRRFLGSSQASNALDSASKLHCFRFNA